LTQEEGDREKDGGGGERDDRKAETAEIQIERSAAE
jgi:hypothetical protein